MTGIQVRCEDAPCCGCGGVCGTPLGHADPQSSAGPEFCDICMSYHPGPCPEDELDEEGDDG